MKRLFLFFVLALTLSSCVKTISVEDTGLEVREFFDVCKISDTLMINTHCSVLKEKAEIQLIKRLFSIDTSYVVFQDKEYAFIDRTEIFVQQKSYKYTHEEFLNMLETTNTETREKDYFSFDGEMYMPWRIFDEIYKTYIEE